MFCFKYTKKRIVEVLVCLGSPADFLNAIFGIYGKLWIDIGGAKSEKLFFDIFFSSNEVVRTHDDCGSNTKDGTHVGRIQCVGY